MIRRSVRDVPLVVIALILATFGLAIVFVEVVRFIFTSQSLTVPPPSGLMGITDLGVMMYPSYRLAVVGICAVALLVLCPVAAWWMAGWPPPRSPSRDPS